MNVSFMFALLSGLVVLVALLLGIRIGKMAEKARLEAALGERIGLEREDAIKRSKAVVGGQVAEQVAPYLPDFPCPPRSARYIGKPVDFVCFPGEEGGEIEEIVFVEVKTGLSELSPGERSIKRAILEGRIRWVEYRIPLE
ncbi:MAG: Holliday junction resolvase-like protein [Spirochaetes bacterium]|nr:MAG: Holliday junction resolvase-like protein [Spirochaetota bacterium]